MSILKRKVNGIVGDTRIANVKRFFLSLLATTAILGMGGTYYFYDKYRDMKADPRMEAQKETVLIVAAVGRLMELPKDETPSIATISDKEKLNGQTFFEAAENGDVLLAYPTGMKAILYRPQTDKIINVAPLSVSPPRIAYYNGTKAVGESVLAEQAIKAKYPSWQTVSLTNATRKDYKKTLVINVSGRYHQEAIALAGLLEAEIAPLPQDETAPDADLLVISGK